jgi:hypothetical protein
MVPVVSQKRQETWIAHGGVRDIIIWLFTSSHSKPNGDLEVKVIIMVCQLLIFELKTIVYL